MSTTKEQINKDNFKNNIKTLRAFLHLTQNEFANTVNKKALGENLTQTDVSIFERNGTIPTISKLTALKIAFPNHFSHIEDLYTKKLSIQIHEST